jgi:hypothetical protein
LGQTKPACVRPPSSLQLGRRTTLTPIEPRTRAGSMPSLNATCPIVKCELFGFAHRVSGACGNIHGCFPSPSTPAHTRVRTHCPYAWIAAMSKLIRAKRWCSSLAEDASSCRLQSANTSRRHGAHRSGAHRSGAHRSASLINMCSTVAEGPTAQLCTTLHNSPHHHPIKSRVHLERCIP